MLRALMLEGGMDLASKKLLDLLNKGIALEMQASIQYMWQHVQWAGVEHFAVSDEFEKIAIEEMKHAEKIAERLFYLGGIPTTQPALIKVGGELYEMVDNDIEAEEMTMVLYKEIIETAQEEGDITTTHIFHEILEDEEEHHDFFTGLKEGKKPAKKSSKR